MYGNLLTKVIIHFPLILRILIYIFLLLGVIIISYGFVEV